MRVFVERELIECRPGCGRRSFNFDCSGDIAATRADVCAGHVTRPLQEMLLLRKTGPSQLAATRHMLAFARKWNEALTRTIAPMKHKQLTQLWCAVALLLATATQTLNAFTYADGNLLLVFGRVPLFYYVVHLYLIHLAAALVFLPRFGVAAFHVDPDSPPAGFGVPLGLIYLIWASAVLAMYPLCRWFAAVKKEGRSAWLSYL